MVKAIFYVLGGFCVLVMGTLGYAGIALLMAIESAPRKVIYSLIWLVGKLGRKLPVTCRVIADVAGLPAESVQSTLTTLEKKGWIRASDGMLHVLQPDKVVRSLEL